MFYWFSSALVRVIWIGIILLILYLLFLGWNDTAIRQLVISFFSQGNSDQHISAEIGDDTSMQASQSGLSVPRWASLKSNSVNVRAESKPNSDLLWTFTRTGWPLEIIEEYENWRRIRDSDNAEGWVNQSLLSQRRTVLIAPWTDGNIKTFSLRHSPTEYADIVALLESNVLASLIECENKWCLINVQGMEGWVQQKHLYGVDN